LDLIPESRENLSWWEGRSKSVNNPQGRTGGSVIVDILWFLLSGNGHKAIQDGGSKIIALYFRLFVLDSPIKSIKRKDA
jgi:hypothetical protein